MAWINVESYWLRYNTKEKTTSVGIKYREGGTASGQMLKHTITLPGSDAVFVADLLRNEKPVFFDPDTGAVATSDEQVGEGES